MVYFADGKFLFEAVGILCMSNYSRTVGLQIVSLGTHDLQYLFPFGGKVLAQGSWYFEHVQLFLDSWIAHCFVWHAWFALSAPFRGKFLARGR